MAFRVSTVALPRWGMTTAPGASSSAGWISGSFSNTSSPAAKSSPSRRASASAASSITGPREEFTSTAVGFILRSRSALIR